jgi:hypothetical protein
MLDRSAQLREQGFRLGRTLPTLLPHQLWRFHLDVEEERPLRLVDETILRLVAAGIGTRAELATLMGTEPDVAVPLALGRLFKSGALTQNGQFRVTRIGEAALQAQSMQERRVFENLQVRYDPWEDNFFWEIDEERRNAEGVYCLPVPATMTGGQLQLRHRDLQELLDNKGIPKMSDDNRKVKRDIVDVRPVRTETRWREADLEVWFRDTDGTFEVRVMYQGHEGQEMSRAVKRLQEEGRVLLPLETPPPQPSSMCADVAAVADHAVRTGTILSTSDHRAALAEHLSLAQEEVLLISPWLTTDAVDPEMLGWIESALKHNPKLRIRIGYGIGDTQGANDPKGTRKADDQKRALDELRRLSRRRQNRLTLTDIGSTHQKLLIRDRKVAIVTSFNWLSFNPRPGKTVRLETGTRISEVAAVKELVAELAGILDLAH